MSRMLLMSVRGCPPNGPAFNGRPGAEPRWNQKDRSARPVRCNAWLSDISVRRAEHQQDRDAAILVRGCGEQLLIAHRPTPRR